MRQRLIQTHRQEIRLDGPQIARELPFVKPLGDAARDRNAAATLLTHTSHLRRLLAEHEPLSQMMAREYRNRSQLLYPIRTDASELEQMRTKHRWAAERDNSGHKAQSPHDAGNHGVTVLHSCISEGAVPPPPESQHRINRRLKSCIAQRRRHCMGRKGELHRTP